MFVNLGIQHAMRMRRIAICGLSGCTVILARGLVNDDVFEKIYELKACDFIFSTKLV